MMMFTERTLSSNSTITRESRRAWTGRKKGGVRTGLFRLLVPLLALAITHGTAKAEVTFIFTYFDDPGEGFNDPALGAARRASLEAVAADIGSRIAQTATVRVGIAPSQFDGTGFIGTADQTVLGAPAAGIFDGEVYRRIVLGTPYVGPDLDAGMAFDFGYVNTVLSGIPGPGEVYMPDVFRHELTHLLGFGSFMSITGTGRNDTAPDVYSTFDTFLVTSTGAPIIDSGGNLVIAGPVFDAEFAAGVFFDGPMTRAANGGDPMQLYFADTTHSKDPTDVMFVSPAIGYVRDTWTARDVAVLTDIGYEIIEPVATGTPAAVAAPNAALKTSINNKLKKLKKKFKKAKSSGNSAKAKKIKAQIKKFKKKLAAL